MSHTRILLHVIWATKNRNPLITKELKPLLLNHIKNNSVKKGIFIESMNCVEDHIHLLISLSADQAIAKVVMLIKGESSFWINKEKLIPVKFEWQFDYFAVSVSESIAEKVKKYIANQEEHHKKKTFMEEYTDFLNAYKFETV